MSSLGSFNHPARPRKRAGFFVDYLGGFLTTGSPLRSPLAEQEVFMAYSDPVAGGAVGRVLG